MTEVQITILNQILIISMHIASLVKRPYLLKLSSGNENIGMSWADNAVKICPSVENKSASIFFFEQFSQQKFGEP